VAIGNPRSLCGSCSCTKYQAIMIGVSRISCSGI